MSAEAHRRPFFLGIDLGGTNIKSGVVDDDGRPISSVSIETEAERGPEHGIASLAEVGRQAVVKSGLTWADIAAVGLGGHHAEVGDGFDHGIDRGPHRPPVEEDIVNEQDRTAIDGGPQAPSLSSRASG